MRSTPRIDAHQHLWRYTDAEYGWIGDDMGALRRDFLLDDLRAAMASAAVDGAVAVQARQTVAETRWLLDLAREEASPICAVVGWLPIADERFSSVLESFADEPRLRGLRHVVQGEAPGFLDGDAFNRGMARMRDAGLVYDLLIVARQLAETTRFVKRHPEQPFVLDHIAKPDMRNDGFAAWKKDFDELARHRNVSCKLSGMVTETDWTRWTVAALTPYLDAALEAFGPGRLMIGTDWPVLTLGASYAHWWETIESWTASLTASEQAAILGGTALRVYGLRLAGLRADGLRDDEAQEAAGMQAPSSVASGGNHADESRLARCNGSNPHAAARPRI